MAPFTFPDPSVQTSVTNPETGDLWIFHDGVWMIDDHHDDSHHNHHSGQGVSSAQRCADNPITKRYRSVT